MKRSVLAGMMVATVTAAPAHSQTIMNTFRQLRSTVSHLGAKPKATDAASKDQTTTVRANNLPTTTDESMVPATVLDDDRSDTRLASSTLVPRKVSTFDVRGFRLGMSPREVGRIADAQHLRRHWDSLFNTTGSFEVEATALANRQLAKEVGSPTKSQLKYTEALDPDGADLKCFFTLEPDGPKLSRIVYRAKLNGFTQAQAFASLARKYGPPTGDVDNAMLRSWSNATGYGDGSSPSLYATVDGSTMSLTLSQSSDALNKAERQLADRAQQIAAARGGGVKF